MKCTIDLLRLFMKRHTKRLIVLTTCVLFIISFILLTAFITTHVNHEHNVYGPEKTCVICVHLGSAENLLRAVAAVFIVMALILIGFSAINSNLRYFFFAENVNSLVCLKTKLSN